MFHVGQSVIIPHPEFPDDELDLWGTVIAVTSGIVHVRVDHDDGTEDLLSLSFHDVKSARDHN